MKKILAAFVLFQCVLAPVVWAEEIQFMNTGAVLPKDAGLPFSEAVRVGDTIYLSGQLGVVPGTLTLVEGGIEGEARQTLSNIRTTLEALDLAMSNVVKCTVMLADIEDWPAFNEVYKTFFEAPYPTRSAFATSGLALGARTEVECLAVDLPVSS